MSNDIASADIANAVDAGTREPTKCSCQNAAPATDQFVYALGKIDVRFPSLGIEREFQQREMRLGEKSHGNRHHRIAQVLKANHHLATRICYVLSTSGVPAYILAPTGLHIREDMLEGVASSGAHHWCLVIGRRGPMSTLTQCGGVLAPIVACDQIFCFGMEEWEVSLEGMISQALEARQVSAESFRRTARDLFERFANSTENLGSADAHRGLNYLLVQHPGVFLAAAERVERHILDRIETREIQGMGARKLVAVIFTFLDRATGVPERLYCRVDVTEEWPFIADSMDGSRHALGLLPFVENSMWGMAY
jgi:hypothetical protein